ncbi:MAG: sigma-54-dependent Fis family transcriptional regulator [Halomonadaceae bacterium]|nr:MAG: sigma-54-dependent Fis family transcriptional regulator [Halomonadaceae bacterium]
MVVEDDRSLAALLQEELELEDYTVRVEHTCRDGIAACQSWNPALIISDLRLPDREGMELLRFARSEEEPPLFLLITAFGTVDQAVEALKAGADEFLTKPLSMEHLLLMTRRLLAQRALHQEVSAYRAGAARSHFHGLLGDSEVMHQLFSQIRQVAQGDLPVLVLGESGVGKELVARAIHNESPRADHPFIPVNCAGIPPDLMESEFFGHSRGAFTGADRARPGLFREAHGGTLLLDEIAEMPLQLQAKLLRALQEGRVKAVGSDREEAVNVRIIAATHRDLRQRVASGEFREDLYYRLETLALQVPPLRERDNDLEQLAMHFTEQSAARNGRAGLRLDDSAMEILVRYPFPGNIRELANTIERAVTFCNGDRILPEHLPQRVREASEQRADVSQAGVLQQMVGDIQDPEQLPTLESVQQIYVDYILNRVSGNKRQAAKILGINRRTLYRWLAPEEPGN